MPRFGVAVADHLRVVQLTHAIDFWDERLLRSHCCWWTSTMRVAAARELGFQSGTHHRGQQLESRKARTRGLCPPAAFGGTPRTTAGGPNDEHNHTLQVVVALLLVAGSLGLSNFAASIAIGLSGVDAGLRLKVVLAFGLFEAGMPLLGLLGRQAASDLGSNANLLAGGLLAATGLFTILAARRADTGEASSVRRRGMGRLLLSGAALSIDNLIVGFALGTYNVPFAAAVAIIATVSMTMSLAGLELGERVADGSSWRVNSSAERF